MKNLVSLVCLFFTILTTSTQIIAQDEVPSDSLRSREGAVVDSLREENVAEVDTSWKKKIEFGANLNQGSFSSNWTGGAVSSVAFGVFTNALITYEKDKNSWRNDFQAQYGIVRNKGQESRKSVDRLFFDTKYGREISPHWSFIISGNLLTQFTPGYEYNNLPSGELERKRVSGLFSPAYVTEALGIEYKPVEYFFITFSPGAVRQTIVADLNLYKTFPKNYGVPIGRRVRNELALLQLVANFNKDIAKNVNLKFRYLMFASYQDLRSIDNRLDAMLTAKINKYWNVNLGAIVIYDDDQSNQIQLAQSLSIGFLYTF
ncbi:DUF3078 domain-containing protein [Persicitalea jodogahamensis]|uniref:DUF3078 domain-containing protein n=1 Tax=Persicitalea jodogahamensis TaxID=402147 RepID=A0A8J3D402_9BACT|nr:DUF3078 domain-containing protein [Persicitalea jodogahamensis]GHB71387.1 hypothetical protein GCM10007390_26500 [Persicitalea jodogahamensis]